MSQENPMGTDGFEFVEFSALNHQHLPDLFTLMNFMPRAQHKSKPVTLYQHGEVKFIVNHTSNSFASEFTQKHGPCACGMGFRVKDAKFAFERAIKLGAKPYTGDTSHIGENVPAIYGIGDSLLYLIDDYEEDKVYQTSFNFDDTYDLTGSGLILIDHLTHNVYNGEMNKWAEYYQKLFNFEQIRYFDIQGKHTGLVSRAMGSPCGKIKIPLNESKDDQSQIVEYLNQYNGEGIQHIAMTSDNIFESVEALKQRGLEFMPTPDTYFSLIENRLPNHGEDLARMRADKVLIDGGPAQGGGLLLQIFTKTVVGPIFFEIIQRKGNEGFGEGNFQALFESIELDQIQRGAIDPSNEAT